MVCLRLKCSTSRILESSLTYYFRGCQYLQKSGLFYGREVENKKETPSKGCLRKVLRFTRLLIECSSNVNSTCYSTTYHWVVTDAEESHHLNVCWN